MQSIHLMVLVMLAWGTGTRDRAPVASVYSGYLVMDTVRGVVFDSITNEPMSNAFVIAEPGGALTATTDEGRFILVSPARVRKISVYHDVTEQLGIPGLVAIRPDPSAPWRDVRVATPSMTTLWSRFCAGERPGSGMGGIMFGTTRAGHDTVAIANALVSVTWRSTAHAEDGRHAAPSMHVDSVQVRSDTVGKFVACGVRESGEATVLAASRAYRSGSVVVPSSERSLRRVDVLLGDMDARGAHATSSVRGRVLDSLGSPIARASVVLEGAGERLTDAAGWFAYPEAPTGTRMLSVRKAGYRIASRSVDVVSAGVPDISVVLDRPLDVVGARIIRTPVSGREQWELATRRTAGVGQSLDSLVLQRHRTMSSVVRLLAGFSASGGPTTRFVVWGADGCKATIFVDGALDEPGKAGSFQRLLPSEIGVMEAFVSGWHAPARFQPRSTSSDCGVLLVWTREALRQ